MEVFLYELRRTTRRGQPALVRFCYGLVLLVALGLAALSLFCSVRARTVPGAIAATYLAAVLFFTLSPCVPFLWPVNPVVILIQVLGGWGNEDWTPGVVGVFGLSQLLVTLVLA